MKEKISGIYQIKCLSNNKIYIGSSINIYQRWKNHKWNLNKNTHHSIHLQNCWNKYGESNFEFKVLLICDQHNNLFYEQRFIDAYDSSNSNFGLNIKKKAESPIGNITKEEHEDKEYKIRGNYKRYLWKGELRTLTDIAELEKYDPMSLISRVVGLGYSVEKALTKEKRIGKYMFDYQGQQLSLKEVSDLVGIHPRKLNYYLQEGLTLEQAIDKFEKKKKQISLREFCKVFGISDTTVKSRLKSGLCLMDALHEAGPTGKRYKKNDEEDV